MTTMINSSISRQLFRRIFGLYLMAAVLVTAVQLSLEYRHTQDEVASEMQQVLNTFTPGIIDALWNYDKNLISSILIGMHELAVIDGIQVFDHRGLLVKSMGVKLNATGQIQLTDDHKDATDNSSQFTRLNKRKVRLTHYSNKNNRKDNIGEIVIYSSNRIVIDRVKYGFILIIINSVIKTLALWLIFLYFINRLLTRPLMDFSQQLTEINLDNLANKKLIIDSQDNELHVLQNHFNEMIEKIKSSSDELQNSHSNVERVNIELAHEKEQLEVRVKQRTQALKNSMEELANSSKMASLSKLLTTMAHEFNTPLGIAITANSYQQELIEKLQEDVKNSTMTKDDMEEYIHATLESTQLATGSLDTLSKIINRFKQLDVNQSKTDLQTFSVGEYIELCLHSYQADLTKNNVNVTTVVKDDLTISSDPGIFSKVILTLVNNAIAHGFKNRDSGNIHIDAHVNNGAFILHFQDDGEGIDPHLIQNIFDPFTSNMAAGGTGLGLNIIYNLITFQLDGSVICHDKVKNGAKFTIRWPLIQHPDLIE